MPPVATADLEPTALHPAPGLQALNIDVKPKSDGSSHKQFVMEKYKQEATKRVRPPQVAMTQYLDPAISAQHSEFAEDPWIDASNPPIHPRVAADSHSRILIIGAGFGGIFYAVEALKAGFALEDIRIVDPAGGFGGTWYWNRGPGLMSDVESYIYLPYLEEMGYMPRERYASGEEIRQYVNDIATKYKLFGVTCFGTSVKGMHWNEERREWDLSVTQAKWKDPAETEMNIRADFVCHASGILHRPKLPAIPGLETFQGPQFHTARWNYKVTGGSPGNANMEKLSDKRVAIVGTGATAIQAVPRLAECAKHLYVVQRTPSAVAVRGQRTTDPSVFKSKIAQTPGWQLRRQENFMDCTTGVSPPPAVDMVDDGWTDFKASVVLVGTPDDTHEREAGSIPALVDRMNDLDLPRQDRIRSRVESTVKDAKTAEGLKAWYPGWCKRPCFHDEYLEAFNKPNVTLVDTNGQSIEATKPNGFVVNGKEYAVDVIVWSTGFNANGTIGDPATRGAMDIVGRNGRSLSDMWAQETPRTLHSVISGGFPNLFFISSLQGGASIVFTYHMQQMAVHAAYIMKAALDKAKASCNTGAETKVAVEPTCEAIDDWEMKILMSGGALKSAMAGCTPGYYNMEGLADQMPPEIRMKKAKIMPWGKGMSDLRRVLEEWRDEGSLKGLELRWMSAVKVPQV